MRTRIIGILGMAVLATCALPLGAQQQQVAPQVQPVWSQNGSPQPVTSSSGLPVNCITGCNGGGSGSPAPYATAVSPAPGNLLGAGYSAAGTDAPIICHHHVTVALATTQATATLLVALSGTTVVHVCAFTIFGLSSAGNALYGIYDSNLNTCAGASSLVANNSTTTGTYFSLGNGQGEVTNNTAGHALCFLNPTSTPTQASAYVLYEQFLRALDPDEIQAYCSVPKRCALFRLFKELSKKFDTGTSP